VLIRELLYESDVVKDIDNDLMDFIMLYRNKNRPWAPMSGPNGAVEYMRGLSHKVDANNLMNVLASPPFTDVVEKSGPEHIKIKTSVPDPLSDKAEEKEADKMDKTAEKAAEKTVKSGELS
jgi:hypothetical protein